MGMIGPTLILAAAPRAGSTQLCRWLASHPDIGLSLIKEPNHFSAHEFDPGYVAQTHLNDCDPDTAAPTRPVQFAVVRRPDSYERLFQAMPERWRIDGSTSYLACPESPGLIRAALPECRIILLTRDPVGRAVSHFGLARRTGRTRADLGSELQAELDEQVPLAARYLLRPSRQMAGVARFRATFPDQALLHLQFNDLIAAPQATLTRIAGFLDIDPNRFTLTDSGRNQTALPRLPGLNSFLLRSGIKTRVRAALPAALKSMIRPLWFNESARPVITPADLNALKHALSGEGG